MLENGLIEKPVFENPGRYLVSGKRTEVTPLIESLASRVEGTSEEEVAKKLLVKMNQVTRRLENASNDERKFKRSAEEILASGQRTGCCDSSTLYTSLLRARGIPAMQVITVFIPEAMEEPNSFTNGHFFTACFLKDLGGNGEWKIVDSDKGQLLEDAIEFRTLNQENRNITKRYYAIAYSRDYSEAGIEDTKIDSIHNMLDVQRRAFAMCDQADIDYLKEENKSR